MWCVFCLAYCPAMKCRSSVLCTLRLPSGLPFLGLRLSIVESYASLLVVVLAWALPHKWKLCILIGRLHPQWELRMCPYRHPKSAAIWHQFDIIWVARHGIGNLCTWGVFVSLTVCFSTPSLQCYCECLLGFLSVLFYPFPPICAHFAPHPWQALLHY